jgi:hypothetical protein
MQASSTSSENVPFGNLLPPKEDFDFSSVRSTLIIGATGHRDIPQSEHEAVQGRVHDFLVELRTRYTNTPMLLLTSLAEGADRLCAYAALSKDVHIPLLVPLPMAKVMYEQDFEGESLAEFHRLLHSAVGWMEMPLIADNTSNGVEARGPQRDLQYESVGRYIAQKSQILIALWDGEETNLTGGTASVIRFQRDGILTSEPCTLESPEGSPIYHILTPRKANPERRVLDSRWLYPSSFGGDDGKAKKYFERMFSRIDDFNHSVGSLDENLRAEALKSKMDLLLGRAEQEPADTCKAELDRYGMVDALAIRFQRNRIRAQKYMHCMVFLAFFSLVLFAHFPVHILWFLVLSFIFFILAYLRSAGLKKKDEDTKYEDFRSLAEGLRVQFFWRAIGLRDSVVDYYLWKQRTELDWMRNVFRGWSVRTDDSSSPSSNKDLEEFLGNVGELWIEQQRKYFACAAMREQRHLDALERVSRSAIRTAIAAAVILLAVLVVQLVPELLRYTNWGFCNCEWVDPFLIVIETTLAVGALLHNYCRGLALAEHVKQYARMSRLFARASESLKDLQQAREARAMLGCLKRIGIEALSENGDWVMLHRERPLEVPHP